MMMCVKAHLNLLIRCWSLAYNMKMDIIIVGSGVAGLYCALNLPKDKNIIIVTKNKARRSDSD